MWKKDEIESSEPATQHTSDPRPVSRAKPERPATNGERASIGRSISIKGDISGDEDLYIQGTVDGSVKLKEHNVTISSEGRVKANVHGRTITVQGKVEGDLFGEEQVVLRPSCHVRGNITAARVALEDGANFRGTIDMESKAGGRTDAAQRAPAEQSPPRTPVADSPGPSAATKVESKKP